MKKHLSTGKNQAYEPEDKQGNVIINRDKAAMVAEVFYSDLYSSRDTQDTIERKQPRIGRHSNSNDRVSKEWSERHASGKGTW